MVNRYYNSKLGQTEMYLSLVCHKKAARPGAVLSSQCESNLTVVRDISATLMSVFVITLEDLVDTSYLFTAGASNRLVRMTS